MVGKRAAIVANPLSFPSRLSIASGFPRIAKHAKELGATIVFADESGLSSQCVYGRTWGVAGKTPVVRVANSRFRLNMFAAISPEGEIYFMIHEGRGTAERF